MLQKSSYVALQNVHLSFQEVLWQLQSMLTHRSTRSYNGNSTQNKKNEDNFLDKILKHAEEGKSFTCLGPPGVGKTHVLNTVFAALQKLGETVVCLAPTHCANQLLPPGNTCHYFLARFGMRGNVKGWISLDEISMMPLPILAAFDQFRQNGTKICTFGDWQQLPPRPEANSWRGTNVSAQAFEKTSIVQILE